MNSKRGPRQTGVAVATGVLVLSIVIALAWGWAFINRSSRPVREFAQLRGLSVAGSETPQVFLATRTGLIRSGPQGLWYWVGTNRDDMNGFVHSAAEPGTMYTSGRPAQGSRRPNPLGLRVSRDWGETWTDLSLAGEVNFHVLAVSPANPRYIYGWDGALFYQSDDAGRSWQTRSPAAWGLDAGRLNSLAAHPKDPRHLVAAFDQGVARTLDAGATWSFLIQEGPATAVAFDPEDETRLLVYLMPEGEGHLYESRDGGSTWTAVGAPSAAGDPVTHLALWAADPAIVYAGTAGASLYRSDDGGRTWMQLVRAGRPLSVAP